MTLCLPRFSAMFAPLLKVTSHEALLLQLCNHVTTPAQASRRWRNSAQQPKHAADTLTMSALGGAAASYSVPLRQPCRQHGVKLALLELQRPVIGRCTSSVLSCTRRHNHQRRCRSNCHCLTDAGAVCDAASTAAVGCFAPPRRRRASMAPRAFVARVPDAGSGSAASRGSLAWPGSARQNAASELLLGTAGARMRAANARAPKLHMSQNWRARPEVPPASRAPATSGGVRGRATLRGATAPADCVGAVSMDDK